MQIKSLTLKNFRGFKDTEITFSENLTVLVGVNGAGKSSVLDALAMLMRVPIALLRGEQHYLGIQYSDITADEKPGSREVKEVEIKFCVDHETKRHGWGHEFTDLDMEEMTFDDWLTGKAETFARELREKIRQKVSIPLMCYYPAVRSVVDVPIPIPPNAKLFDQGEAYTDCLSRQVNFHSFFEWFRAREDYENEKVRDEGRTGTRDTHLEVVRQALGQFLPEFSGFKVKRFLDALVADKNGREIEVERLSDGEKLKIAMVGDLARRLAMANPSMENPLQGEGVVLIDEIEQHLHPKWQREIIGNLRRTFPNVQFIVSTHSPQVLGEVEHDCIRRIAIGEDGSPVISTPSQSLGLDANLILEELFGAPSRNKEVATELTSIFREIDKEDAKSLAKARREIKKLKKKLNGEIPDLVEAEAMLFMLENQ